jgi:lipopolysaccharide biosynthesis glycosyltransferase
MLSLSPPRLGAEAYARLLRTLDPDVWTTVQTAHTDSVVLNRHFHRAWTPASERYNYFVSKHTIHYTRPRVPMSDAVILHFVGRQKPWHPRSPTAQAPPEYARALAWWDDAARIADR